MDIVIGSLVRAKAGRDKGGFFVVTDISGNYAYICDGRRRKVQKPKRKNIIHLEPTSQKACEYETNRQIKAALSKLSI